MRRIDDIFPKLGIFPALIITIVFGAALQLSGAWMTMLMAGVLGSLFVKRHRIAFLVGFLGVFIAWLLLFVYLIVTAQALVIADFFLGLLGLSGLGWLLIVISCLIGGLLGGFGAILGRSLVELVDSLLPSKIEPQPFDEG
jgi:hypothetical protein